jgi:hypothetical protein
MLKEFENWVLRKIFGPKRDKVTAERIRLQNEQLNDPYSPPNIFMVIKLRMSGARHVACVQEKRGAYSVLVGEPEGKKQLGRPKRRLEDNIKMDL